MTLILQTPTQTRRPDPAASPRKVACPHCGAREGFLVALDGIVYRVLEDDKDRELLIEAHEGGIRTVSCHACKRAVPTAQALALPPLEQGTGRMGPRRNRIHQAGRAAERRTGDGRRLPMCPECGATHDFFVDLDGVAYHVMEDDNDTDLLGEAPNLLCARCHAVFEW